MCSFQTHRGPDDSGIWISQCKKIYLGHNRLSIIDLSKYATQPMLSYDNNYVLVFNGEIYNYKELYHSCLKLGSKFKTKSDSEVIIESYRHWGVGCFSKFKGMWALLIYDLEHKKAIISRDPFAIKPLYYAYHNNSFYFASEIKAFLSISDFFNEQDLTTATLFLDHSYLDRDEWTFYKNIRRFPHANYSIITLDSSQSNNCKLQFEKYWKPPSAINYTITYNQAVKQLKELLHESISLHLTSDVPVGTCLSGGIDSSAIACIASKITNQQPLNTFTTTYSTYKNIDESKWAKLVINDINATAHFTEPTEQLLKEELQNLLVAQDEPFGSLSIFAQYCIYKKIHEANIKVVLTGQGADEMLSGYIGFISYYFDQLLRDRKFYSLLREIYLFKDLNVKYSILSSAKSSIKSLLQYSNILSSVNHISSSNIEDEYNYRLTKLSASHNSFENRLEELLCESNIPQLLRYDDRNSMNFSIESRVPFLQTDLVDFILTLPASFRVKDGFTKAVLRDSLAGVMPDAIKNRRDKLGFPVPEQEWLNKCYNIKVNTTGSKNFREFIYSQWQDLQLKNIKSNSFKTTAEDYEYT